MRGWGVGVVEKLSEINILKRNIVRNGASCDASTIILRISQGILKTRARRESFARKPISEEVE